MRECTLCRFLARVAKMVYDSGGIRRGYVYVGFKRGLLRC